MKSERHFGRALMSNPRLLRLLQVRRRYEVADGTDR
jgi:hypothetical protein